MNDSRQHRTTLLTAAIMFVAVTGAYLLLDGLRGAGGLGGNAARSVSPALAALLLLATPLLHRLLSGPRRWRAWADLPPRVEQFEDYLLPSSVLLLHGVALLFAASGVGILVVWLLGVVTGRSVPELVAPLDLVMVTAAAYLVGALIGSRGRGRPYNTVFAVILVHAALAALTTLLVGDSLASLQIAPALLDAPPALLAALLGAWRGQRARHAGYAAYLLATIPRGRRALAAGGLYETVLYIRRLPRHRRRGQHRLPLRRNALPQLQQLEDFPADPAGRLRRR